METKPRMTTAFRHATLMVLAIAFATARAQEIRTFAKPQDLLSAMLQQEMQAAANHDRFEFLSDERSDRTGGHLWHELVVETSVGRVRKLLAEDGKPISADRAAAETTRLNDIAAHPDDFAKRELAQKNDEAHARSMLDSLPRGYIMDNVRLVNGVWFMDFHPNPDYSPSGLEEKVLHGMSGKLTIDAAELRLIHIEASLPTDVSIGFGILATIKAGSHFYSDREKIEGHWRTVHTVTDIRGKAILFKTVARNSDLYRADFKYLDSNITPPQAVALLLHQ